MSETPRPALRVDVRAGPKAGLSFVARGERLTFGRSPRCDVQIDQPEVSREHGEFRWADGRWTLVIHSPNDTRLNGKRIKPAGRAVPSHARVSVGDREILSLHVTDAPARAPHAGDTAASPPGGDAAPFAAGAAAPVDATAAKRRKLWTVLGLYLLAMLGLFVFLSTLDSNDGPRRERVSELTPADIEADIRREVEPEPPNELTARAALREARDLYAQPVGTPDRVYRAFAAFRRARAHLPPGDTLDPLDRRRFTAVEDELIRGVTERYQRGYNQLRAGRPEAAAATFADLAAYYPDPDSRVFANVQALWDRAKAEADD